MPNKRSDIVSAQVSLTLRGTVDDFYDNGGTEVFSRNIAYTLGIPMDRIRVVDVVGTSNGRRKLVQEDLGIAIDFFILPKVVNDSATGEATANEGIESNAILVFWAISNHFHMEHPGSPSGRESIISRPAIHHTSYLCRTSHFRRQTLVLILAH